MLAEGIVRVWAAVHIEGIGIVAKVSDHEGPVNSKDLDRADHRVWRLECITHEQVANGKPSDGDCAGKTICRPGAACSKCMASASEWWVEWKDRKDRRLFHPMTLTQEQYEAKTGWSSSWYCDCKQSHMDLGEAIECAQARRMAWIREADGSGKTIQWHEVPPAAQVDLFGQ